MSARPDSQPAPRTPLSRERVLRAAIELADEQGIDALSMRKLGERLGVEAMSLYNHVANKDDLLDGLVELVHAEVDPPVPGGDWKAELRRTAVSSYEIFTRRHRWACGLSMAKPKASPVRLEWMEAVLRTLREGGFSPNLTHHAYHALESHITGFTLWVVSMPFETHDELVDLAEEFLPQIPADRYPYVVEHAQEHLLPPDPEEKSEFEFGLDLILDGLERLRDEG